MPAVITRRIAIRCMDITCYYKKESNTLSGSVLGMKRRLKKETKRRKKHGTGHSVSRSFTIGLISGMSQLDYRYSQFPVTFLYIAQKPAIVAGFFMVGLFGFEPKTSSMSTKRSNQLSYNPMSDECIIHDMRETCKMLFCNFLHMARQMRHPRCNSPSCYGSQFRRSTPPILSASFTG